MSTVTENDLKELKDLLNGRFDRLENKRQDMEIKLGKIAEKTAGLDKRLDDLNSRFNLMNIGVLSIAQTPSPSPNIPTTENLVGFQAQDIVYIGSFLLLIIAILVIGLLSKKLDYALIFALILSLILIGLLWLL